MADSSCPYCFEHANGSVGRCIRDECAACCDCGRQLRVEREDGLSGGTELVEAFGPEGATDVGCNGDVCGWWPCECPVSTPSSPAHVILAQALERRLRENTEDPMEEPTPETDRAKQIHERLLELTGWDPDERLLRAVSVVLDEFMPAKATDEPKT